MCVCVCVCGEDVAPMYEYIPSMFVWDEPPRTKFSCVFLRTPPKQANVVHGDASDRLQGEEPNKDGVAVPA